MEAYAAPLEELAGGLTNFVRSPDIRLLAIETSGELRRAVVDLVMAFERTPENLAPFYAFEQPHSARTPAWAERSAFAEKQARHRAADPNPTPTDPAAGHAGFAAAILQLLNEAPPGTRGVVIVLAPSSLGAPETWVRTLRPLLRDPRLEPARFIVVETDPAPTAALADELDGGSALVVRQEPGQTSSDIDALLRSLERPAGGAKLVGAQPPSAAPAHPSAPPVYPPTAEGELRALVSNALISAVQAMRSRRAVEAVSSLRSARDLVAAAGLQREAINLELVLGGALVQAGGLRQAQEAFGRAVESASSAEKHDQAATAHFALGATKLAARDRHGALVTYAEGTVCAERSNQPALAIEGGRLTGSLASDLGLEAQAIAFWSKAVKLAKNVGPQAPLTSAGESARSLAQLCRKRGLSDQAANFESQANDLERLVVPDADVAGDEGAVDEDAAEDLAAETSPRPAPLPVPQAADVPRATPPPRPAGLLVFGPPADEGEGTDMLSVEDIARLHWGARSVAEPSLVVDDLAGPEAARPPSLSADQLETLRGATNEVLDDEATDMLTAEEIAMLRGEVAMFLPVPVAPLPVAPPSPPTPAEAPTSDFGLNLDKIAMLRDVEIEDEHDGGTRVRRRDQLDPSPSSSDEGAGEGE